MFEFRKPLDPHCYNPFKGEVASRSAKDINSIRIAAGEKVGYITMNLALIIAVSPCVQGA
jgi:hypothetical protein